METTVRQMFFQVVGGTYRGVVKRFFGTVLRSMADLVCRMTRREERLDRAAIKDLFGVDEDLSHSGYEGMGKTISLGVYWL
ncbi:MAG TPA: hypothetical protein PKA10_19375 [Selenomonadales bacterium]|nr:hypothetical protein [Selenomonadales bacterium]